MRFDGKRVIVSGGASGFGRAISQSFAARGAQVMVTDIDIEGADEVASGLEGALAFRLDVTDEDAHVELANLMADTWGGIDIVAANAGFAHRMGSTLDISTEEFDLMWAVNTLSVYFAVKYFTPLMPPGSSIVSTASIGGKRPRPGLTPYNTSKAATIVLTRGLTEEFAPDIRINCVAPVASDTAFFVRATGQDTLPDPLKQSIIDGIPMGRMTDPTDVANAVMFLASDESSFLTGVCLDVDGGRSIS